MSSHSDDSATRLLPSNAHSLRAHFILSIKAPGAFAYATLHADADLPAA